MWFVTIATAILLGFFDQAAVAEQPENPWIQATEHVFEPRLEPTVGMTKKQFVRGRGIADKREIRNGEEVWWYDGDEPYYATFKNNKLTSYYIDKETIAQRAAEARRYDEELRRGQEDFQRAQQEDQEREERRLEAKPKIISESFKPQPMPYQIKTNRPVNTNCTQIGNQVSCTSY